MPLCYKDQTFCEAKCSKTRCLRHQSNINQAQADLLGLGVATANFSKDCPEYVPVVPTESEPMFASGRMTYKEMFDELERGES